MQIYRAEDGELFQVNKTLQDIERSGGLERFLHEVTVVEEAAVLAYLSDGRRLRNENIRELAGAVDQSIFVFNKHYLDYELEDVLLQLQVEPSLQPESDSNDFGNIDTLANAAALHYDSIVHIFNTIHVQHEALRIASTSLDLHVLSISDVFQTFAGSGRRELEKQARLLQGLNLDLVVISKIKIHLEFLSPAVRKAVEAGEKARTLGDYVSNVKMRQVGDACAKTHNELRDRFNVAEESMARLSSGADAIRFSIVNSGVVEEAELCTTRSQEALERITDIRTQLQEPRTDEAELLAELGKLDVVLRDDIQHIVDLKNKATGLCIRALRHISHLNNDLVLLPQMLSSLQSDFRVKTSFAHIQRLHNMLYAYGATLVEIVRRKEFSRFFSQRAQTIAEIMAKLSSSERKRRQIYRGEVHGQLPFDAKGMDDNVPAMEITSTGLNSSTYSIERDDLMTLLNEVDKIEQSHGLGVEDEDSDHKPLRETRAALEKLINRMDNLETTFDKMAEKTIFSASRVAASHRRQSTDHTDGEFQELVEQLHEVQDAKGEQERQFSEDHHRHQAETDRLHSESRDAQEQASREKKLVEKLRDELRHEQAQNENNTVARHVLEDREAQLLVNIDNQQNALSEAELRSAEQARVCDDLRQELARVTADSQEAKRLEMEASGQLMTLISDKELLSRNLDDARTREKDLESQLSLAREDVNECKNELSRALEEKDQRLRAQALEADRVLRDVIAEADGDRAVLEHQLFEMRAIMQNTERQLKESKAELDVLNADVAGLREELQRTEHELRNARIVEGTLTKDLQATEDVVSSYKTRLGDSERLANDLLQVATAFRDSHCRAFAAVQASPSTSKSLANLTDSTTLLKPYVEPPLINPDDLAGALRILSEYDFTTFNDVIAKMGSTIRKWQKQCKEYRDRAKGKITFRNFAKGDLALFLPTRNSISKPWAAFNVSFPHYFLQATGTLADQLKTREWIVARITSITEQVASIRDPNSNPYGLGDGTKFFMLQVEGWTQSSPRRKSSPPKPCDEEEPDPAAAMQDSPEVPEEASTSAPTSLPQLEGPVLVSRHFGPRQRTHSAPGPHPSSLSRLLAQGTPPIEEVTESTSPSPPRSSHSRPASPLARPLPPPARPASPLARPLLPLARPSSPLARPPSPLTPPVSSLTRRSLKRHSSPLVSPPHSRPSSPLASPSAQYPRPSSPLAGPSYSQPSPPLTSHAYARPSPPLAGSPYGRPPSPLAGHSRPQPPSPLATSSPAQPSPKSATSALHSTSRRSSSSSRPSTSSIFSNRHPFTLSSSPAKASPTTALTDPSASAPVSGISSRARDEPSMRSPATPGPESSPSEGLSNILHARRRTTSASTHGSNRLSSLAGPENNRTQMTHKPAQGALASLANSWGFVRKGSSSARHTIGGQSSRSMQGRGTTSASPPQTQKPAANEILRRYDDILPQERGSR